MEEPSAAALLGPAAAVDGRQGMAVKEWFRRLRPAPLYLMLVITAVFFVLQLVMSHMTHALTLLVDAYHMLCNLIALAGCIITIKYGSASAECEEEPGASPLQPSLGCHKHESAGCSEHAKNQCAEQHEIQCVEQHKNHLHQHHHHHGGSSSERRLKNTFGWARIDVLVMLIGCVFLNSLCFSLVVEALQTLIHIGHQDEMHHPIPVLIVGIIGLLINGLCYILIGGYTFHQASFLHVNPNGEVVLDHVMNQDSVRKGQRRLSAQTRRPPPPPQYTQRQGPWEMCRDTIGCFFVIACALIVYFTDEKVAKFVDPSLSILSAISLLILSYPYMRESGSILLQTIPDTININSLRKELLRAFPDILNVHDLHVWRLTASRVFSTAHIIFLNNKDYSRITKEITDFFHDQGITQVTIQPEFFQAENANGITALPNIHDDQCLVPCLGPGCSELHCCANTNYKLDSVEVSSPDSQKLNKSEKGNDLLKRLKEPQVTNTDEHQASNEKSTDNISSEGQKELNGESQPLEIASVEPKEETTTAHHMHTIERASTNESEAERNQSKEETQEGPHNLSPSKMVPNINARIEITPDISPAGISKDLNEESGNESKDSSQAQTKDNRNESTSPAEKESKIDIDQCVAEEVHM